MSFDPSVPIRLSLSEADLELIRQGLPAQGHSGFPGDYDGFFTKTAAILRTHFPDTAPLGWAAWRIGTAIAIAVADGELPIRISHYVVDSASREFGTALNTIREFGPKVIANNDNAGRTNPSEQDYVSNLNKAIAGLLDRAEDIVGLAGVWSKRPPRRQDVRSRWHWTARYFRSLISQSFRYAGAENKVANSREDKTVVAISELLKLLPVARTATPDTVRAALFVKKDSAKDFP
jgi:hypothetical protein